MEKEMEKVFFFSFEMKNQHPECCNSINYTFYTRSNFFFLAQNLFNILLNKIKKNARENLIFEMSEIITKFNPERYRFLLVLIYQHNDKGLYYVGLSVLTLCVNNK